MHSFLFFCSTLLLTAITAIPACAVDYTWNGGVGLWTTSTSWSPVGIPGTTSDDQVTISSGTVTFPASLAGTTLGALTVSNGATLVLASTSTTAVTVTVTQAGGGVYVFNGLVTGSAQGAGVLITDTCSIEGGQLTGVDLQIVAGSTLGDGDLGALNLGGTVTGWPGTPYPTTLSINANAAALNGNADRAVMDVVLDSTLSGVTVTGDGEMLIAPYASGPCTLTLAQSSSITFTNAAGYGSLSTFFGKATIQDAGDGTVCPVEVAALLNGYFQANVPFTCTGPVSFKEIGGPGTSFTFTGTTTVLTGPITGLEGLGYPADTISVPSGNLSILGPVDTSDVSLVVGGGTGSTTASCTLAAAIGSLAQPLKVTLQNGTLVDTGGCTLSGSVDTGTITGRVGVTTWLAAPLLLNWGGTGFDGTSITRFDGHLFSTIATTASSLPAPIVQLSGILDLTNGATLSIADGSAGAPSNPGLETIGTSAILSSTADGVLSTTKTGVICCSSATGSVSNLGSLQIGVPVINSGTLTTDTGQIICTALINSPGTIATCTNPQATIELYGSGTWSGVQIRSVPPGGPIIVGNGIAPTTLTITDSGSIADLGVTAGSTLMITSPVAAGPITFTILSNSGTVDCLGSAPVDVGTLTNEGLMVLGSQPWTITAGATLTSSSVMTVDLPAGTTAPALTIQGPSTMDLAGQILVADPSSSAYGNGAVYSIIGGTAGASLTGSASLGGTLDSGGVILTPIQTPTSYSLVGYGQPSITTTTISTFLGVSGTYPIATIGILTSLQEVGGALPPGLGLVSTPSVGGESYAVGGTPTMTGSWTVTLSGSNPTGSTTASVLVMVYGPPTATVPPTILGFTGGPLSYQISADGLATAYSLLDCPNGLLIYPSGLLTGTVATAGTSNGFIVVSNPAGSTSQSVIIDIQTPPTLTGTVGQPLTYAAPNQDAATSFTLVTGTLPPGVTIDPSTGFLWGTPTNDGIFNVLIDATAGSGTSIGIPLAITVIQSTDTSTSGTSTSSSNGTSGNSSDSVGAGTSAGGSSGSCGLGGSLGLLAALGWHLGRRRRLVFTTQGPHRAGCTFSKKRGARERSPRRRSWR